MGQAVYSPGGVTIEDEAGNKVNYSGQSSSPQVIAVDMNAQTAQLTTQLDGADKNAVPNEQRNPSDITVSTSSVVTVR